MGSDEHLDIKAEKVYLNTGWTEKMVLWNTIGTVVGAFVGLASLVLSIIAIIIARS